MSEQEKAQEIDPPDVYDVALAAMTGLLANPNIDPNAAAGMAWMAVGHFFAGAQQFARMNQAAWEADAKIRAEQQG